jgi:O-antigen/teichoic acid export membrane protein
MLVLALTANGAVLLAAWITSPRWVFPGLLLASCLPALGLAAWLWARRAGDGKFASVGDGMRTLSHYLLPGLSIGILSPLSWLVIRGLTSESMSWQGTALMLALSRVSDWVTVIAATALYLFFLPRMSSAAQDGRLLAEIGRAALRVLVPSAAALAMLGVFQREVLVALYDPTFVVPDRAVALFFAGDLARVSAWIFLYALYAQRRTLAIALGEVLSLPLFAFLLFCLGPRMTLETAGLAWLATYLVYAGFCAWAALRISGRNDARMLQRLNNRVGASPIDRST